MKEPNERLQAIVKLDELLGELKEKVGTFEANYKKSVEKEEKAFSETVEKLKQ